MSCNDIFSAIFMCMSCIVISSLSSSREMSKARFFFFIRLQRFSQFSENESMKSGSWGRREEANNSSADVNHPHHFRQNFRPCLGEQVRSHRLFRRLTFVGGACMMIVYPGWRRHRSPKITLCTRILILAQGNMGTLLMMDQWRDGGGR